MAEAKKNEYISFDITKGFAMKRGINKDFLPIFLGMICLAILFTGVNTQEYNAAESQNLPNQRYLCKPSQDPLMLFPSLIRTIDNTFERTTYLRQSGSEQQDIARFLVADNGSKYPLHIYVKTDVKMKKEGSSINRTVETVYGYNPN